MKKIFLFICLISLSSCLMGQPFDKIYQDYDNYKDSNVFDRRFKHADIMKALEKLPNKFPLKRVGTSVEGRSINMVQVGNGPVKVLLWSQMHGNEPTATMAILDLFNFFAASDEYDGFRNELMQKCSFYFIPMLNPDGAEKYQRRNAMDVDLNRDAQRLQNPESICLKSIRDSLEPDWGFNLHDQNRYYSAGAGMPYTASFSFLAPAFNRQKDLSPKREDAMQLIGHMNRLLQKYIPNKVGQYDDTFEPRAFGDNIQKWGTRTILIEVGGLKDDPEKQYLRKLHFMILLKAFQGIAYGDFEKVPREEYEAIPFNKFNAFHDIIVRKATVLHQMDTFLLDLGLRLREIEYDNNRYFYTRGFIADVGDLSTSHGYTELDGSLYELIEGKVYPDTLESIEEVYQLNLWKQIKKGYLYYHVNQELPNDSKIHSLPIQLLGFDQTPNSGFEIGNNPALHIQKKGKSQFLLVNGRLFDVRNGKRSLDDYR